MSDLFGSTRTAVKARYSLLTPDGFVPSNLPGWKNASCVVNVSPATGARFTQLYISLSADGIGAGNTGPNEYFVYVIDGAGTIDLTDKRHRLETGSYIYLPPDSDMQIRSGGVSLRLLVFQKRYERMTGTGRLVAIVAHEREVKGQPCAGNEAARLQALLPDQPEFDMAVNLITFQPGAAMPAVQTPVTEHGLFLLNGQGICRLENDWHPVQAGDAIWTSPCCPQWFVAMGQTPARLIQYGDVNRDPM